MPKEPPESAHEEHARHPGTASTPAGRLTLLALHVGMYR